MKLSEIEGEKCFEVIADLVTPVANIAQDENAVKLFQPKATPEGKNPREFFIERLQKGLPALLRDHKDDFIAIMATLNDVDRKEYLANLNLARLFADVFSLLTDEEFAAFLS